MNKKKWIKLGLTVLLAFSLTACGTKDSGNADQSNSAVTMTAEAENAQEALSTYKKAGYIIGKAEPGGACHCLKCPNGTGAGGCRTRVAIQPRYADRFPCALIQSALDKIRQMQIGQ